MLSLGLITEDGLRCVCEYKRGVVCMCVFVCTDVALRKYRACASVHMNVVFYDL